MEILIENIQDTIDVTEEMNILLCKAVELSLQSENFTIPAEVSILLVNNETIQDMNCEHREIDRPTDVLSFPVVCMEDGEIITDEGDFDMDGNLLILGDIVISMEKVEEQAAEYGHSFERELAFLATHGMFHLLGYDHGDEKQEKRMMEKQEAVLEQMGLQRK
ncbi:MAG: rRNA maturation RNase YbeY [Clostridia bacterium]|nr:rRNA maturation RNase YbeY [Clostridia bacterium]